MSFGSLPDRQLRNDASVRELAPQLTNETLIKIFGIQDLTGIPSGIRQRIISSFEMPLSHQAWKALKGGDVQSAKKLFAQCLSEGSNDLSDDRFFSVYWGVGEIAAQENNLQEAIDQFKLAIKNYPSKTRESHFIDLINTILKNNPDADNEAAAIAQQGLQLLRINPNVLSTKKANTPGVKLLQINRTLEKRHNYEARSAFPRTYLGSEPNANELRELNDAV